MNLIIALLFLIAMMQPAWAGLIIGGGGPTVALLDTFTADNGTSLDDRIPDIGPSGAAWGDYCGGAGKIYSERVTLPSTGNYGDCIKGMIDSGVTTGTLSLDFIYQHNDNANRSILEIYPAIGNIWGNYIAIGIWRWDTYNLAEIDMCVNWSCNTLIACNGGVPSPNEWASLTITRTPTSIRAQFSSGCDITAETTAYASSTHVGFQLWRAGSANWPGPTAVDNFKVMR